MPATPKVVSANKSLIKIEGLEELLRTITSLKGSVSRSAMVSGMKAAMARMARGLRKEVTRQGVETAHAASLKAGMRKSVGSRFLKGGIDKAGRSHATVAKVGFAVGKKGDDRMSKGTTGGVGVTRQTTHWFVLGTPERVPGEVKEIFGNTVARAANTHGDLALRAGIRKAKQRFEKLAAKRAKRRW